ERLLDDEAQAAAPGGEDVALRVGDHVGHLLLAERALGSDEDAEAVLLARCDPAVDEIVDAALVAQERVGALLLQRSGERAGEQERSRIRGRHQRERPLVLAAAELAALV